MSMFRIVLVLVLFVVTAGLMTQSGLGEGYFEFNAKGKAEDALDEMREVEAAMDAYAADNDGQVNLGDPTNALENNDLFYYLKEKDLLRLYVGKETNVINEWTVSDDDDQVIQGVVKSSKVCKYINRSVNQRSVDLSTPNCGTPEAEGLACCFEEPDA